jgi:hypothetical protein
MNCYVGGIKCKLVVQKSIVIFMRKGTNLSSRNLNIGFATKCEVQGFMRPRMCLGVKHTFTNGEKCKG